MPVNVSGKRLLAGSFVLLGAGAGAVLLLSPGRPWLLVFPLLAWGALFMYWAYRMLKDPHFYG